jgi:hypothetical protein
MQLYGRKVREDGRKDRRPRKAKKEEVRQRKRTDGWKRK